MNLSEFERVLMSFNEFVWICICLYIFEQRCVLDQANQKPMTQTKNPNSSLKFWLIKALIDPLMSQVCFLL